MHVYSKTYCKYEHLNQNQKADVIFKYMYRLIKKFLTTCISIQEYMVMD